MLAAALLAPSARAYAAPDARELKAREYFASRRYQEALDLFAKLYAESLHPNYLRNIGRCYQNLGQPDRAIVSFHDYLRKAKVSPEERIEIEGFIKEMEDLKRQQQETAASAPAPVTPLPAADAAAPPPPPATDTAPPPRRRRCLRPRRRRPLTRRRPCTRAGGSGRWPAPPSRSRSAARPRPACSRRLMTRLPDVAQVSIETAGRALALALAVLALACTEKGRSVIPVDVTADGNVTELAKVRVVVFQGSLELVDWETEWSGDPSTLRSASSSPRRLPGSRAWLRAASILTVRSGAPSPPRRRRWSAPVRWRNPVSLTLVPSLSSAICEARGSGAVWAEQAERRYHRRIVGRWRRCRCGRQRGNGSRRRGAAGAAGAGGAVGAARRGWRWRRRRCRSRWRRRWRRRGGGRDDRRRLARPHPDSQ